jgi:type IV secretory pathway VirB2 component (pilin)
MLKFYNNKDQWTSEAGWGFMFLMLAVFVISTIPSFSFAAGDTANDAIGSTLCLITNSLTGTWGKAIATVAIVALGIGLFLGKLSWGLAMSTAIGVGLIFGAGQVATFLGGTGASCSTAAGT